MSSRLDDRLRAELAESARARGTSVAALVERFIKEGLAADEHPGIVFKPGPSGRRAALAGGRDVWKIVSALRRVSGGESERIAALADEFGLVERQVVLALAHAAAHGEEIDIRIRENDHALDEAEPVAAERARLFAGSP